jgi:hypothetical protein
MEFKSKSNIDVVINPVSFQDQRALKNAIQSQIDLSGLDVVKIKDLYSIAQSGEIPTILIEFLNKVDIAENVFNLFIKCLERSLYDGEKITIQTFERQEAKEDYYEIFTKCLEVNIAPFFKNLF